MASGISGDGVRSPLYYLIAPTGFPNFGDELIAAGWLRHLAEVAPEATVWLDCHTPGQAQVLLGALHPNVRFTDTLWRLSWDAPSEEPWEVAAWVAAAVADPGKAPRWTHGLELLSRADVVHLLGGGYVNGIWPKHLGLLAGAGAALRRSGGRGALTGLGLTPAHPDAAALLRTLVEPFEVVDVRDRPSAELLGIAPGVDDAFLALPGGHLADPASVWPEQEPPEVMLCLQSDLLEVGAARLAGAVLAMLDAWSVRPEAVCVVEGIPRVDREIFELLAPHLPGARFLPFAAVWDHGLPVAPAQTWISTRFHFHLVAAAAGAAGVALSVHPDFYGTKHRSLIDAGSGWVLADDLDAVPARPAGGGFARTELERFRQAKLDLAKLVYAPAAPPEEQAPRRFFGRRRG